MKTLLQSICLTFAIVLFFMYNMMDNVAYFAGGTLFAIPGIIDLFNKKSKDIKTFAILVFISSVLNILISTSYGIGGSIIFLIVCGITISCLKNLKILSTTTLLICLWLIIYLYNQLFILETNYRDVFAQYGLSPNYPGSLLVMFNCIWGVWKYLHYGRMPLLLPIFSTFIALFLDGRTSLVCMVLITVFCFIFRGKQLVLFLAVAFISLIVYFWNDIINIYDLTAFGTEGVESERYAIWNSYFDHLDITSIFFGLDTQNIPVIKEYNGNPHNSFLSYHRRMGLLGLCTLLYYILKGIREQIKRKQFVLLFFNIVIIIRISFDGTLVTPEDFFILTLFFLPLCFNNEFYNIEKQIESRASNWIERGLDYILLIF